MTIGLKNVGAAEVARAASQIKPENANALREVYARIRVADPPSRRVAAITNVLQAPSPESFSGLSAARFKREDWMTALICCLMMCWSNFAVWLFHVEWTAL